MWHPIYNEMEKEQKLAEFEEKRKKLIEQFNKDMEELNRLWGIE